MVHKNIKHNDFDYFLKVVKPCRHDLTVACESTFNWYWLADTCATAGLNLFSAMLCIRKPSTVRNPRTTGSILRRLLIDCEANLLPEAYTCRPEPIPPSQSTEHRYLTVVSLPKTTSPLPSTPYWTTPFLGQTTFNYY